MDKFHILNFHSIFSENASCLSIRLGIPIMQKFEPEDGHYYLIYGAQERILELLETQRTSKVKYIIMQTESPKSNHMRNKYYLKLLRDNVLFDYCESSTKYLHHIGIRTVLSKIFFENKIVKSEAVRDIDILFVGASSANRIKIRDQLLKEFPDKNIIFDMNYTHVNQEDMTRLLIRAKIVLNIPFYDHTCLQNTYTL